MNRRTFVQTLAALPVVGSLHRPASTGVRRAGQVPEHVAVIGAGAFGGWTALHLLRSGAAVTLIDAWGPGNARASSGGGSRVIRYAYTSRRYVDLVARAFEIWDDLERTTGRKLLHRPGVLFMGPGDHNFGRDAQPHLDAAGVEYELWDREQIASRYPQIDPDGLDWGIWEPTAGYLLAREGCRAVVDAFLAEGGTYRTAHARPARLREGELEGVVLSDGSELRADRYVFACGPWLGRLFPDVLGDFIRSTRQEVFFFGTPAGDRRYGAASFPVWADFGPRVWYGIPGNEDRGFKIADDTRGPEFDPTEGDRRASEAGLRDARSYLARRFPGLAGAPLLESRVCQYEETPDGDFIVDRHPEAENLWLVGGGSGHGYKHGASLGEYVARCIRMNERPDLAFSLARFG